MRNIFQYPLNSQDILATLEHAQKEFADKKCFGSMDGGVYAQLLSFLKDEENMKLVLDFKPKN